MSSHISPGNEQVLQAPRRRIVAPHGVEDAAQIFPRRRVGVEAVQEEEIANQTRHPAHRGRIAEDRLHTGALHELARERDAALAAKYVAGGEVNEVAIAALAVSGESGDEVLGADALRDRAHGGRAAVEGEVIDRRVEELLLAPHQAARTSQVVREAGARVDETMGDGEWRLEERRHAVEKCFHRKMAEHLLVPVRLEADELARRLHGAADFVGRRRPTMTLFAAAAQVMPLATATKSRESSAYSCATSNVTPSFAAMNAAGPPAVRIASTTGFSSRAPRSLA